MNKSKEVYVVVDDNPYNDNSGCWHPAYFTGNEQPHFTHDLKDAKRFNSKKIAEELVGSGDLEIMTLDEAQEFDDSFAGETSIPLSAWPVRNAPSYPCGSRTDLLIENQRGKS